MNGASSVDLVDPRLRPTTLVDLRSDRLVEGFFRKTDRFLNLLLSATNSKLARRFKRSGHVRVFSSFRSTSLVTNSNLLKHILKIEEIFNLRLQERNSS